MRHFLRLAVRSFLGVSLVVVLYVGVTWGQILLRAGERSTARADVIVVFGTAEDNGRPSPTLQRRLEDALALWRDARAPYIAVTGYKQPGDTYTEAQVEAMWLLAHGVPRRVIVYGAGVDTWQNVATIVPMLRRHHLHSVLVATDPFHEYRAMAICAAQGLTPFPAPDHSWIVHSIAWHFYAKEAVDVAVGRIVGYGLLSQWTTGVSFLHPHVNHG